MIWTHAARAELIEKYRAEAPPGKVLMPVVELWIMNCSEDDLEKFIKSARLAQADTEKT